MIERKRKAAKFIFSDLELDELIAMYNRMKGNTIIRISTTDKPYEKKDYDGSFSGLEEYQLVEFLFCDELDELVDWAIKHDSEVIADYMVNYLVNYITDINPLISFIECKEWFLNNCSKVSMVTDDWDILMKKYRQKA